jgi:hypothetical protein
VVAIAAAGILAGLPATAGAAIAYSRGGAIMVADDAGQNARRVGFGRAPVISPDGTRIALLRRGTDGGLALILLGVADGREVATGVRCAPRQFAWAPDSTRLACVVARSGVSVVGVDGAERVLAAPGRGGTGRPAWSPDSTRVVWSTSGTLHWRAADGRGPVRTIGAGWGPEWGPRLVAFERGGYTTVNTYRGSVWTVDPARGAGSVASFSDRSVTTCATGPLFVYGWTPDGTGVVVGGDDRQTCESFAAVIVGSKLRVLGEEGVPATFRAIAADGAAALLETDEGACAAPLDRAGCTPLIAGATNVTATAGWRYPTG